ncbi:CPBP family intramembrane metalloprotease [Corynebacterium falsenii]|uniref:CPBP family intramembrane glutamic endopeptidase n=1 Tax=Corynebacterium falsenii TaxID=108486 RepID=UPI001183C76D|nr:type II CAAX endopeptidase family protein [Corynebacterium falsenii]UBI04312.1 CPBP family intramembrane metalloprotease [Corynebacterium falsenii]
MKDNIVIPVAVSAFIILVTGSLFSFAFGLIFPSAEEKEFTLATLLGMAANTLFALWFISKVSKMSLRTQGWIAEGWPRRYLFGMVVGIGAITIVFVSNLLLRGIDISWALTQAAVPTFLITMAFFLFQGAFEEIIFRGYLLPQFAKSMNVFVALIVTSLMFAALHGTNSNMSVMGMVNLVIFGLVFGSAYLMTGDSWKIGAGHTFWNMFLGIIYGSHVSGLVMEGALIHAQPRPGMALLSGGEYGMEGSIVASIVGIALIVFCLKKFRAQNEKPQAARAE